MTTAVSMGFALPLAYGFAYGDCAPTGIGCLAGGVCVAECADAWRQFPVVLILGFGIGFLAGSVGAAYVRSATRRGRQAESIRRSVSEAIVFAGLGTVFALALFPLMGSYMLALMTLFALLFSSILGVAWVGALRLFSAVG